MTRQCCPGCWAEALESEHSICLAIPGDPYLCIREGKKREAIRAAKVAPLELVK